ncbi:hypothetical protein M408DRAFT_327891 [Serendipita vermifera MAFF 305830]|uniref:Autophagy-related protein 9 n=1 Tax=Serendipita vermifera MAFF 305830 TaxID=933852 RepID=A0A0C3BHM1_SERVB|nr:hypothetical protein M408DRAFT_327891 [Serendipita vermifera MAFF 305830]
MSRSGGFLDTLNPIAKSRHNQLQNLHSYEQTSSLLEEDEDADSFNGDGQNIPMKSSDLLLSPRSRNIATLEADEHATVTNPASEASDEEVPQSFMIEASPSSRRKIFSSQTRRAASQKATRKGKRPSGAGPLLPTAYPIHKSTHIPHPDDIEEEEEEDDDGASRSLNASRGSNSRRRKGKQRAGYSESGTQDTSKRGLDEYQQALWRWVNVYNLDEYLQEIYYYYANGGFTAIALSRVLNLLTVGFVILFTTFLWGCIDYGKLSHIGRGKHGGRLEDVVIPRCLARLPPVPALFLFLFSLFYAYQLLTFFLSLSRLYQMRAFYTHLLKIPDVDISTLPWSTVVTRIGAIRDENPITAIGNNATASNENQGTGTAKLDAHDIANRIMRQENYLIALFNKDLLNLELPFPPIVQTTLAMAGIYQKGSKDDKSSNRGTTLTRALEWNLRFCLMDYLFDSSGRVKDAFLKEKSRDVLIKGLQTRFIFMGCLNVLFIPFIIPYLLIYSFFRYFEEAQKNPATISGRRYTPYAEWKFREFNELPHLFTRRLDTSYPTANMYLNQYPNTAVSHIARFVSFIAGSFAGVLILGSLLDPDLVLNFEITHGRTVLFWIGVFGGILAVTRGMITDGHLVFDPEILMKEVIRHTHYMPEGWKGELHSQKVHQEFSQLFTMKVAVFVQEILSVILTPIILTLSLPLCAPAIIDFFREFTIHVDTLGYVCSFAVFDFKRHGNIKFGAPSFGEGGIDDNRRDGWQEDERLQSKDGKMEKSFLAFKAAHPEWAPTDPTGSLYLERLREMHQDMSRPPQQGTGGISRRGTAPAFGIGSTLQARSTLAERSELYEKALAQSMANARARRAMAGSLQMTAGPSTTTRRSDSHPTQPDLAQSQGAGHHESAAFGADDRAEDGGIGSELGDSYVDDVRTRGGKIVLDSHTAPGRIQENDEDELEAEELANGGVLGLLAQIYDRKRPVM